MPEPEVLRIGTRGSALARWQAEHIAERLRQAGHRAELVIYSTKGDRLLDLPLAEIGEKGLFTDELDRALVQGEIHLAVHSLKDLPTVLPHEVVLAAVTSRAEPWDAFVAHPDFDRCLVDLPRGATVATSSLRRKAQLLAWRPDLEVVPVRGNVPTRIAKLDESGAPEEGGWHGLILAAAGLVRLGLEHRITERIDPAIMLPAVSQGALGVVAAENRSDVAVMLRDLLEDADVAAQTSAERALLRHLEGGCQVPVAARATLDGSMLHLEASVATLDGTTVIRDSHTGDAADPETLGVTLAQRLLDRGADSVLRAIREKLA